MFLRLIHNLGYCCQVSWVTQSTFVLGTFQDQPTQQFRELLLFVDENTLKQPREWLLSRIIIFNVLLDTFEMLFRSFGSQTGRKSFLFYFVLHLGTRLVNVCDICTLCNTQPYRHHHHTHPQPCPNVRISSASNRQQKYRAERINGFLVAFWLSSFDYATKCSSKHFLCFGFDQPVASVQFQTRRAPPWGLLVVKPLLKYHGLIPAKRCYQHALYLYMLGPL